MKWSRLWGVFWIAVLAHLGLLFVLRGWVLFPGSEEPEVEENFFVSRQPAVRDADGKIIRPEEIWFTVSTRLVDVGGSERLPGEDFFGLPRREGSVVVVIDDALGKASPDLADTVRREVERGLASRDERDRFNLIRVGPRPVAFRPRVTPAHASELEAAFIFLRLSEATGGDSWACLQRALEDRPARIVWIGGGKSPHSQGALLAAWQRATERAGYEPVVDVVGVGMRPRGRAERTWAALAARQNGVLIRWQPQKSGVAVGHRGQPHGAPSLVSKQ